MAKFEVGDRVKVNYRGWEGEGIVREITPKNWYHVDMLTGNYAHVQGDFIAGELEAIPTFQPGDIVRAERGYHIAQNEVEEYKNVLWLDGSSIPNWEAKGYTVTLVKRPESEIVLPTKPYALIHLNSDVYIFDSVLGLWVSIDDSRTFADDEILKTIANVDDYRVIFEGENE